jgi:hypothetical protein
VTAPDSTTLNYKISTISVQPFTLHTCLLGSYAYNTADTSYSLRSAVFTQGTFSNSGASSYTNNDIAVDNTIFGTKSYHLISQPAYQYALVMGGNQIRATTNVTVSYMEFVYLIMLFAKCNSGNPYLLTIDNTCHSACPVRTSTNNYYSECHACPTYDCEYCDDTTGLCTQCSAADNREMDPLGSSRCTPKAGYYDDGTSLAKPCTTNCIACTASTNCQQCSTDYTYTAGNNSCWLDCSTITNCATCHYSAGKVCDACSAGYTLTTSNNSCWLDCSTITNCATCHYSSGKVCDTCATGYTLTTSNNSCWLDCSTISSCVTCHYISGLICDTCSAGYVLVSNQCLSTTCAQANCATCTTT